MLIKEFLLGEKKLVSFCLHGNENDTLVISDANYELKESGSAAVVDSGACIIEGHRVKALVCADRVGNYDLIVTVRVPPETVKGKVNIVVVE